jgi:hypothetical protein
MLRRLVSGAQIGMCGSTPFFARDGIPSRTFPCFVMHCLARVQRANLYRLRSAGTRIAFDRPPIPASGALPLERTVRGCILDQSAHYFYATRVKIDAASLYSRRVEGRDVRYRKI